MEIEWNIDRDIRGGCSTRSADEVIAELAAAQHGVVSRAQLVALGVGPDAVDRRIAARRLHPIHRGVFAVGHRLRTGDATWMAAVLAAGADSVLGFRSAAALWQVRASGRLEVIGPRKLRRPGIEVHRIALAPDEVTAVRGIRSRHRRARSSTSPPSSRRTSSSTRSTRRSTGGSRARSPSMPSSRGTPGDEGRRR